MVNEVYTSGVPAYAMNAQPGMVSSAGTYVTAPIIEPQPWVKDFVRALANNSYGVVRIDLRRPTVPEPGEYDGKNILVKRTSRPAPIDLRANVDQLHRPHGYLPDTVYPPEPSGPSTASKFQVFSGARVKVTRNFMLLKDKNDGRSLVDLGLGANFEMDTQRIRPVARLKLKGLLSVHAVPLGMLRFSHVVNIPRTSSALRMQFELPLSNVRTFWEPPSRLMIRLENAVGSGIHFGPGGLEFDNRMMRLGDNLSFRTSASLRIPRSLPIDRDRLHEEVALEVHRLSLKANW